MLKKIISAVSAVCVMAVSGVIPQPASAAGSQMRNLTTAEIVRDMGIGINLGNTLESCGDWIAQWGDGSVKSYETAWGSPDSSSLMSSSSLPHKAIPAPLLRTSSDASPSGPTNRTGTPRANDWNIFDGMVPENSALFWTNDFSLFGLQR